MSAKIYQFDGQTVHDLDPDQVLSAAIGKLDKVIILGYENGEAGNPFGALYMAASSGNIAEAIYLLEKCKRQLLEFGED